MDLSLLLNSTKVRPCPWGVGGRGSGAVGVFHTLWLSESGTYRLLLHASPKLVYLKYAGRLQIVHQLYQGWRGVANKGTSPRACGWEGCLPLNLNRRSGARHQPFPYWQFLDGTPLHQLLRFGTNSTHFGILFTACSRIISHQFTYFNSNLSKFIYYIK